MCSLKIIKGYYCRNPIQFSDKCKYLRWDDDEYNTCSLYNEYLPWDHEDGVIFKCNKCTGQGGK